MSKGTDFCNASIYNKFCNSPRTFFISRNDVFAAFNYYISIGNGCSVFVGKYENQELVARKAFLEYIDKNLLFDDNGITEVSYAQLAKVINDSEFERIPEIVFFNTIKSDFIDLFAFSRNIFYMILRLSILQSDEEITYES